MSAGPAQTDYVSADGLQSDGGAPAATGSAGVPEATDGYRGQQGLRRLREGLRGQWLYKMSIVAVPILLLLTIFGPIVAPYPPDTATADVTAAPSLSHLFGTDASGFDVFSRAIAAPRIDISIALSVAALAFLFGSVIGLLVGLAEGYKGELFMRGVELVQAFPLFVLAIVTVVMLGGTIWDLIAIVALLNIPIYIRLVRAEVLRVRERTFVEAARAAGLTGRAIALRHVLPNSIASAVAQVPVTIGYMVLLTAGLSFIGVGVRPPAAEWGSMVASGTSGIILGQWWMSFFPGLFLALSTFVFAAFGEYLHTVYRNT